MDRLETDREAFVALIQHWHARHPREDQVEHCINVASWLERALDREPHPVEARRDMILAALGQDLYEDTPISPAEIIMAFGPEVDCLIRGVTEDEAAGVAAFVERVASGP